MASTILKSGVMRVELEGEGGGGGHQILPAIALAFT